MGVFLRSNEKYFQDFTRDKHSIDKKLGGHATWNRDDEGYWSIEVSSKADLEDRGSWPIQHAWLAEQLLVFLETFKPYASGAP